MDRGAAVDVLVVGAGPSGSRAAYAAARAGARTLLLDRAAFPRYKTCGGGLIAPSLAAVGDVDVPVQQEIDRVSFTRSGADHFDRGADRPVLRLVDRAEFDTVLLEAATAAGAEARTGVQVTGVEQDAAGVRVRTSAGELSARAVVGADGSTSRIGRHVGVRMQQTDLGLEVELGADQAAATAFAGRVHLDWGPVPGCYAWVFPKRDRLTVGVIMAKGRPQDTRDYLRDFVAQQGLAHLPVQRESGHLTRCRSADSPLQRGRVLVAGDAAGLLEPWTREGISYAVRSGLLAGECAARVAAGAPETEESSYPARVREELEPELAVGRQALGAFTRHPRVFHAVLRTPLGWSVFGRLTGGGTTLASVGGRRPVAVALAVMNRW